MVLKDLRLKKDLTTAELAQIIETTPEEVAAWESSEPKEISSEYLQKLADFYECTPAFLQNLQQNAYLQAKKEAPKKKPIVCPHCKSKELAFVTEAHKAIVARVFELLCIFFGFVVILGSWNDLEGATFTLLYLSISVLLLRIYIFYAESKTHVQCICKECGNVWLHDSPFNS